MTGNMRACHHTPNTHVYIYIYMCVCVCVCVCERARVFVLTFMGTCIMIYFYSKTNEMHQFSKCILFCSSILHVSDGLSVHHHESKTVHTASGIGLCHTGSLTAG
jgi:hypothetical protein